MDSQYKSNMEIIDKFKKNIKEFIHSKWIDEVFWILLVVFVALGSFSLGARYERKNFLQEHPVSITKDDVVVQAWKEYVAQKKSTAHFFASKNGSVYYPLDCSSGDRIKEENRTYFLTEEEAKSAGYKKSSRCF